MSIEERIPPTFHNVLDVQRMIADQVVIKVADWAEQEIEKILPAWQASLLKKTKSHFLARLTGIKVAWYEDMRNDQRKVAIYKRGKKIVEKTFIFKNAK